jgi:hypothetical protein
VPAQPTQIHIGFVRRFSQAGLEPAQPTQIHIGFVRQDSRTGHEPAKPTRMHIGFVRRILRAAREPARPAKIRIGFVRQISRAAFPNRALRADYLVKPGVHRSGTAENRRWHGTTNQDYPTITYYVHCLRLCALFSTIVGSRDRDNRRDRENGTIPEKCRHKLKQLVDGKPANRFRSGKAARRGSWASSGSSFYGARSNRTSIPADAGEKVWRR